jgi:uncharacterized protein YbjT (DUF2867 family)
MKIVITGSLGNISKPLSQTLIVQGHEIIIISSKADKQQEIEVLGAKAAIGSVADADFMKTAFTGADAVYAMTPPNFGATDMIGYHREIAYAYAEAVKSAGVKHIVYLSSYGADLEKGTGFIIGLHHAEKILSKLEGVAVTFLRPVYFYHNLFSYIMMIKGQGIIGANYGGDDKLVMVSPLDIAAAAAEELTTTGATSKLRYIASDEYTCNQVAAILGAAIGKPGLQWLTFTDGQVQKNLEGHGISAAIAALLVELGAATHEGLLRRDYEYHKPALGKVKLQDFAKEFAEAYNKE